MTKICVDHVDTLACFQTPEIIAKTYCIECIKIRNKNHRKERNKDPKKRDKDRKSSTLFRIKSGRDENYFSKIKG